MGLPAVLPRQLYTAGKTRDIDRQAIDIAGIAGLELMERAGAAAFWLLRRRWPRAGSILVASGLGNNAGDGYVVARHAHEAGLRVTLAQVGDPQKLSGDARTQHEALGGVAAMAAPLGGQTYCDADVIVDALFGTGLGREVKGDWRTVIEHMNAAAAPVLALDLPSGLDADTGAPHGVAVKADTCATFVALKQGMFTGLGPELCGRIEFFDLGIPESIRAVEAVSAMRLHYDFVSAALRPRPRHFHKGDCGHVLIVGGEHGYAGAVRLAGEAAARVGAGLVSIATRAAHAGLLVAARPELMTRAVEDFDDLLELLQRATVLAVGPGLGRSAWSRQMWEGLRDRQQPMVVDADALNWLAESPHRREGWVLTPHPGEAARLLGCSTAEVQSNRFEAAERLASTYGGVVVLKGAGTLIASSGRTVEVCTQGNPGMASGGMGDVLSGVIAALIAQGHELWQAARIGVCLHAAAADRASTAGERGLLALDLMPHLRRLANPCKP